MFVPFAGSAYGDALDRSGATAGAVARSGQLDTLVALEGIASRRSYCRGDEIFAEGAAADCWYRVVAGTVRLCKLLSDGRRQIAQFYFAGDCFGLEHVPERLFSAEAVSDVIVMRYPRRASEELADANPNLARALREIMLRELASAQFRTLMLGRMSAPERVASFLLDMFERRDAARAIDLPMSRNDIADYLGLTIETVCRVMSALKRAGAIAIPTPHRVELRNRAALAAIGEG